MTVAYSNNATSKLSASISNVATSLSVTTGHGARFPSLSAGIWFYLTLISSSGSNEIVKVTARSGDTMTVERAQDGTSALAFSVDDVVELRITKAMLDDFKIDARTGYLPLSGGTLTGGLTVGGDLLLSPNPGSSRVVGFAGSTNSILVLQAGGVSGSGANIELTPGGYSFIDGVEARIRSLDGSVVFLASTSAATNVVTGALQQQGNQVLHAGNYSTYAAAAGHTHSYLPLSGGTLTGTLATNSPNATYTTPYSALNTSAGGGSFSVALFASGLGTAVAGDALWANNVGNIIISPNAAGKSIKLTGGTWTNTAGLVVDGSNNVTINGSAALTAGNYNSYALPLSGGTLSGNLAINAGSTINLGGQTNSVGYSGTAYGTYIKGIGNTFLYGGGLFYDGTDFRTLLHNANISSYALGSSGAQTINGSLTVASTTPAIIIKDTDSGSGGTGKLVFQDSSSTTYGGIGYDSYGALNVFNNNYNGTVTINGYTALTVGNYSSTVAAVNGFNATGTWPISVSGTADSANYAYSIAGGVARSIPYQNGVGSTVFTTAGQSGQHLRVNGFNTGFEWVAESSMSVSSASYATTAGALNANLPVTRLGSGTGASASTFWRGDGTWATPAAAAPTTAQVLAATAGATAGGVGSYVIATKSSYGQSATFGTTHAGNTLNAYGYSYTSSGGINPPPGFGTALSGTWRAMGNNGNTAADKSSATLFLRIS